MDKNKDKCTKSSKLVKLPEKEFVERESLLTEMYKNPNIKSLYHICVSILICLFINSAVTEYVSTGKITVGLKIIRGAFYNFHEAIAIWFIMFIIALFVFIGLKYIWANILFKLKPKSKILSVWNKICFIVLIFYYLLMMLLPPYLTRLTNQPIASSMALMMEQVRLLMKIHAFVRSNVPAIKNFKLHTEKSNPTPTFNQFIYFLFVPTLVYRSEYPRTKEICWKFVFSCLTEFILTIFYMCFVIEKFFMAPFITTCLEELNWKGILLQIVINALPGLLLLLCSFYLFQHSWQNGFAEILRFADRLFYKDWWTSTTYARYFRTWNVVVHDWLYTYVYKDMYEIVTPGKKNIAKFVVFFISAFFHEYILSFSLEMFFPIMFVQFFIVGASLTLIKDFNFIGNIFLWFSFEFGQSIMVSLYAVELYARYNCPSETQSISNYFIPRVLECKCYQ